LTGRARPAREGSAEAFSFQLLNLLKVHRYDDLDAIDANLRFVEQVEEAGFFLAVVFEKRSRKDDCQAIAPRFEYRGGRVLIKTVPKTALARIV
jgi:hypothetical protein